MHKIKRERLLQPGESGYCDFMRCDYKCLRSGYCTMDHNRVTEEVEVDDIEFNSNPLVG